MSEKGYLEIRWEVSCSFVIQNEGEIVKKLSSDLCINIIFQAGDK